MLAAATATTTCKPNTGTDTVVGGDGIDTRDVRPARSRRRTRSTACANDGARGRERPDRPDVENVEAAADIDAETVTITGDGRGTG